MPEFVDTHVHFIDQKHPQLRFSWLEPDAEHWRLGNLDNMKHIVWDPAGLRAEARFTGLVKCVNVQSALGTPDPVDETAWLQGLADATGWPDAIVAHVDLAAPDAGEQIDRHGEHRNLRGIRDFGEGDFLVDAAWRRGAAALVPRRLLLDLDCLWEDMHKALALARALPELVIVLEHAGFPLERNPDYFASWKQAMADLAQAPNVHCKLSGLGMGDPAWTVRSLRPWVEHCLDAYGIERCLFGTNWPVDRLYSGYRDVIDAYDELLTTYSESERRAFFVENAEQLYRI